MTHSGPLLSDPKYIELRDRFAGLVVLVVTMALCIGLSFWAKERAKPESQMAKSPGVLRGIAGWPHAVDAIGSLEAARRSSRPRELRRIVLEGVKSDGTIDAVTGPGSLSYYFQNGVVKPKPEPPKDPKAPKAKMVAEKPIPCPRQTVRLRSDGLEPQQELKENRCPDQTSEPLPIPACSPRDVWAYAVKNGASIRQLAHMEYYRALIGPAWKVQLPSDRREFTLSGDCKRELDRREARALKW